MDKESNATPDNEEASQYAFALGLKQDMVEEAPGVSIEKRRSSKPKRRESKKKLTHPMLGDATLHYALGQYEEAIAILEQVINQAPHLPDLYHTLGLVHDALGNEMKALNFYAIASEASPATKDSSPLWKLLFARFNERSNTSVALYCLSKAMSMDAYDVTLKLDGASVYVQLGDYQNAASLYEQVVQACLDNVEVLKAGAEMYKACGQPERAIHMLEDYLRVIGDPTEVDSSGICDLLASLSIS